MAIKTVNVVLLIALAFASVRLAEAQQAKKIPRIGYLTGVGSAPSKAFLQGLHDLGYVEGKNISIEFRTTGGKSERLPELAAELVRLKVDAIVADTAGEVTTAKNATATIPIVMRGVADPIGLGLVASLAHPGGNITGVATLAPELSGKRLELLKEVIPKLSRVAVLTPLGEAFRRIHHRRFSTSRTSGARPSPSTAAIPPTPTDTSRIYAPKPVLDPLLSHT